jgi:hypothetical protein
MSCRRALRMQDINTPSPPPVGSGGLGLAFLLWLGCRPNLSNNFGCASKACANTLVRSAYDASPGDAW